MGVIGGNVGVYLLNAASRNGTVGYPEVALAYEGRSKLEVLMGSGVWDRVRDKTVLDFGCGGGSESAEMAEHGARRVIGVDIDEPSLERARAQAIRRGVADRTLFANTVNEPVDVIVSLDTFEHFQDPDATLRIMARLLRPGGEVLVSFGPTWFHPLGGHFYSVFPWAHLVFSEPALVRWRSRYKTDGMQSIAATGLNRITIRRFRRVVAQSPMKFRSFEPVPIRPLRRLHNRLTREFTTSTVRCTLVHR
ncbi:MAG: class I SAM-dependent methyltransferase [Vicinamibacterales bacterium]